MVYVHGIILHIAITVYVYCISVYVHGIAVYVHHNTVYNCGKLVLQWMYTVL